MILNRLCGKVDDSDTDSCSYYGPTHSATRSKKTTARPKFKCTTNDLNAMAIEVGEGFGVVADHGVEI